MRRPPGNAFYGCVMRNANEGTVQSVDRAVSILELLARDGTLGITDLARELGVHKSTASRLVSALERRGLVEQVELRGGYRLGSAILRLAGATDARLDLAQEARPICRRLAAEVGETVNLAVISAGQALYVDQASAAGNLSGYNWVGQRIPLHATSNGKVLLSEMAADDVADLVAELVPYTPATVTDAARLREQLAQVHADGYAVAVDELDMGLTALAAPVRDAQGHIAASLSVSGPTFRLSADTWDDMLGPLRAAAAELSTRLGYRPQAA